MGCWGMGLTQSDEFCEVYDRFMEEYNRGKDVSEISKEILAHYHEEFDDDDGVLHDVYFALAKAEWMCCAQSAHILRRVREIIESDANLTFYQELGADAKDLKLRRKKLDEFYQSLQTPKAKPRKRYKNPDDNDKPFPPMDIGDCFAYKYGDGKRIVVILDWVRVSGMIDHVFCCILKNTYQTAELKGLNLLEQDVARAAGYIQREFLGKSTLKKISTIRVPADAKNRILGPHAFAFGEKADFRANYSFVSPVKLSTLLETVHPDFENANAPQSNTLNTFYIPPRRNLSQKAFPPDLQCGDLFAIERHGAYRLFALTEQKKLDASAAFFCYAWKDAFDEIPTRAQWMQGEVIPLGWFLPETFPDMEKLTFIENAPVLTELSLVHPEAINQCWKPADNALVWMRNLFDTYPDELCMSIMQALDRARAHRNA